MKFNLCLYLVISVAHHESVFCFFFMIIAIIQMPMVEQIRN